MRNKLFTYETRICLRNFRNAKTLNLINSHKICNVLYLYGKTIFSLYFEVIKFQRKTHSTNIIFVLRCYYLGQIIFIKSFHHIFKRVFLFVG